MSEMEELLATVSNTTDIPGTGTLQEHITIYNDRVIVVPESCKKIAVQYDHNVETVTFDCVKTWDDVELDTLRVHVAYMRSDGAIGKTEAINIRPYVGENGTAVDLFTFDWVVPKHATMVNGPLAIMVCLSDLDSEGNELHHWNSEVNKEDMYIAEGLECSESILIAYPDDIEKILLRMTELESIGLSHTIETAEIDGGHRIILKDSNGEKVVDVMHGEKGEKGDKGDQGPVGPEGTVYNLNTGKEFKGIFLGTLEEWTAYPNKDDVLFVPLFDGDEPFSAGAVNGIILKADETGTSFNATTLDGRSIAIANAVNAGAVNGVDIKMINGILVIDGVNTPRKKIVCADPYNIGTLVTKYWVPFDVAVDINEKTHFEIHYTAYNDFLKVTGCYKKPITCLIDPLSSMDNTNAVYEKGDFKHMSEITFSVKNNQINGLYISTYDTDLQANRIYTHIIIDKVYQIIE